MSGIAFAGEDFQRVTLDRFMRESLVAHVPLSFELPPQYAVVELPRKRPPTAIWLEHNYHAEVLRTGRLPRQAGYFRGSLAINVAYDEVQARFVCGQASCETTLRQDMARTGYRVLEIERRSVNSTPVLLVATETEPTANKITAPIYQAYVPLGAGTGVVQIVYRPAPGLVAESTAVWASFKASLAAEPPPASPTGRRQ